MKPKQYHIFWLFLRRRAGSRMRTNQILLSKCNVSCVISTGSKLDPSDIGLSKQNSWNFDFDFPFRPCEFKPDLLCRLLLHHVKIYNKLKVPAHLTGLYCLPSKFQPVGDSFGHHSVEQLFASFPLDCKLFYVLFQGLSFVQLLIDQKYNWNH